MSLSRATLFRLLGQTGYRQEILEKASVLLMFLDRASRNDYLSSRFALKGGTAINLFFLRIPRLSVDIDINYVGEADRSELDKQRAKFETAVETVCLEEELSVRNNYCRFAF